MASSSISILRIDALFVSIFHRSNGRQHVMHDAFELCAGQIVLPPSPPGQPRGQTENVCDKKGRATGIKSDYSVYIGRGKVKIK